MRTAVTTSCSVALVAVMVSGCGNFLGNLGESVGRGDPSKRERVREQRPSSSKDGFQIGGKYTASQLPSDPPRTNNATSGSHAYPLFHIEHIGTHVLWRLSPTVPPFSSIRRPLPTASVLV